MRFTRAKLLCVLLLVNFNFLFPQINIKVDDHDGGNIALTPIGRFYVDGAVFIEDTTNVGNGVVLSDVRVGLKARYQNWDLKVDVGFARNKVSAKDVFMQYNFDKSSFIRAGHFAEPFGLDHIDSSSDIKFMTENTTSISFSPGRNIGVEYALWSKNIWVGAGVFGDGNAINGGTSGDDGYAATGRLVFNPWHDGGRILHFGVAGSVRKADANGYDDKGRENPRELVYESSLLTSVERRKPLEACIENVDFQAKYSLELIAAYKAFFIQSEYFHSNVRRKQQLPTYKASGAYVQIGTLLLGGDYTYSEMDAQLGTPKAKSMELIARYNYTNLDDDRSAIYGGRMSDFSLGANYYVNKFVAFRLNYSNMKVGHRSPFLAGETINSIQGRIQVVF